MVKIYKSLMPCTFLRYLQFCITTRSEKHCGIQVVEDKCHLIYSKSAKLLMIVDPTRLHSDKQLLVGELHHRYKRFSLQTPPSTVLLILT